MPLKWILKIVSYIYLTISSVAQLCPTLCHPMDCSTPGFPVHHQLLELAQTHAHWVGDAIQPSQPLLSPFSSCFLCFPVSGPFLISHLFPSGGQSIGVSASASVLPMNVQDWFPLGWTGWIFLQSKGLSRVFSNITFQKHQFFSAQLSSLLLEGHFKFSSFHFLMFLYLSGNWMGIKLVYCYIAKSLAL